MTGTNQQYTQAVSFSSSIQNVLSNRDLELYELARISGVIIDPQVFKVLVDLLKLDVSPAAIFNVLQNMALQVSKATVTKKNTQNKSGSTSSSSKKKPPVAAKPKKIRVDNPEVTF